MYTDHCERKPSLHTEAFRPPPKPYRTFVAIFYVHTAFTFSNSGADHIGNISGTMSVIPAFSNCSVFPVVLVTIFYVHEAFTFSHSGAKIASGIIFRIQ